MAPTTMSNIEEALGSLIRNLSEENYEQSFTQYRFLFELAQTYSQIPSDLIFDSVWRQIRSHKLSSHENQGVFYPASPLILRFASDAESDSILASHSAGFRSRLCTSMLREFFDDWLGLLYRGHNLRNGYLMDVNLIAHGANLGYIGETAIRNHILQFLTATTPSTQPSYRELALCVLFKIAGATFAAYTDSSVIDRCFELLNVHRFNHPYSEQLKVGVSTRKTCLELRQIAGRCG